MTENPAYPPMRIDDELRHRARADCDACNEELPVLRSFVLPGGTPGAALLHVARTIVRRAERSTWAALAAHGDAVNPLTARYLNRLSDLLFILARQANEPAGDVLWKPGGERASQPSTAAARSASRHRPGGAASSQARKPVSAASLMASSTWLLHSAERHSTTTMPWPRLADSQASAGRRDATLSARRAKTARGLSSTPNASYQRSSSGW